MFDQCIWLNLPLLISIWASPDLTSKELAFVVGLVSLTAELIPSFMSLVAIATRYFLSTSEMNLSHLNWGRINKAKCSCYYIPFSTIKFTIVSIFSVYKSGIRLRLDVLVKLFAWSMCFSLNMCSVVITITHQWGFLFIFEGEVCIPSRRRGIQSPSRINK